MDSDCPSDKIPDRLFKKMNKNDKHGLSIDPYDAIAEKANGMTQMGSVEMGSVEWNNWNDLEKNQMTSKMSVRSKKCFKWRKYSLGA